MSSGLTQRRRGQSTSNPDLSPSANPPSTTSESTNNQNQQASRPLPPQRFSLYDVGGNRIAYDPNEVIVDDEEQKIRLTIMEEVLLLGLKDKQGYLSFWNDSLSYVLRGCIIMELALRNRIQMSQNPSRKRLPLPDRPVEVVKEKHTGEVLLDETLRLMKQTQDGTVPGQQANGTGGNSVIGGMATSNAGGGGERWSVGTWIDLLSGETWNIMRISYQLRQVRERLAKGLVDKGVLRTEKRNFLLFDMATHPVSDPSVKAEIIQRVVSCLSTPSSSSAFKQIPLRTIATVCAAYAGNVLENALVGLNSDQREKCWNRADELLSGFSKWDDTLVGDGEDASMGIPNKEIVAAVLNVFSKMDSLL